MPQENCLIWNFSATHFVYVSMKSLTKALKLLKMFKKWGLRLRRERRETGKFWAKIQFYRQSMTKYMAKRKSKKKKKMGKIKKLWYLLLHKFWPPGFHIRPANGEFHQSFLTYRGNIRLKSKISWFYINLKCNDWFGEATVLFANWFCWEYP